MMYRNKLHDSASVKSGIINTIMNALYEKNPRERLHSARVSEISVLIAEKMNLADDDIKLIKIAGLMHDIGKIGISEKILNKTSSLTKEEYEIIKMHPVSGERIIRHIELFQPYRPIIRSHHEWFDGSGYPDGLKGEAIPLEVRIVSLADAFDSMTSSRAYRSALPPEIALEEIKLFSGTQFDPELVDLFINKQIYLL